MDRAAELAMQEEYIDFLTRIAFEIEEKNDLESITTLFDSEAQESSSQSMRAIWEEYEFKKKKQNHGRGKLIRKFRWVMDIAAVIIVLAGIYIPIAIAHDEKMRARIYQLVIENTPDSTKVYFDTEDYESFYIPYGWEGDYYPSYIPEGMKLLEDDERKNTSVYQDNGKLILFEENGIGSQTLLDTEGASSELAVIHHIPSIIYEKTNADGEYILSVLMVQDNCYLLLKTNNIEKQETLKIAESVRNISTEPRGQ